MQTHERDLIVIGAGVIGLACAWRCAQAGLTVTVLERDEPGAGASGIAAGMLAPVTEADFSERELLELNLESRALWPGFAAELEEASGLPSGYADSGALVVAADRDDAEELRRLHAFQRELGLDAEWLTPTKARALEPGLSPRIGGAIVAPQDGHADPRAVVRALVVALEHAGGELKTGAAGEDLEGENVLVAAGAWSGPDVPVRPVKGQLLELRTRGAVTPPARRIIRTPRCYLVPRPDGRVVLGATQEEQGFDTTVTADGVYRLLEAAYEVLPDIGELELTGVRAGLRPGTPDNRPLIGAYGGRLYATGHHRNGILLAPLTARAIAALVTGAEPHPAVAPCDPGRFAQVAR